MQQLQYSKSRQQQLAGTSNSVIQSPLSNGTKTLPGSANRVQESAEERRQKKQIVLMPNFRSISPSIFNIDLNQAGEKTPNLIPSPNTSNNQIYVSIQSKKDDEGLRNAANSRIKRVGRLNKGDKIKFGVLI